MTVSLVPLDGILRMGNCISPCFFLRWSRQPFTKSHSQGEIHLKQVNLRYGDVTPKCKRGRPKQTPEDPQVKLHHFSDTLL